MLEYMMFLAFLLSSLSLAAEPCRPSLGSVLAQLTPRIETEQIDPATTALTMYESGHRAAVLVYRIMPDRTLSIDVAQTDPGFRNMGYNSTLFQRMLSQVRGVTEIESTLMEDNLQIYQNVRRNHPDWSPARAVMETPAYRVRARYGFSRIIEASEKRFGVILRVGRETAP